jgi:hypothetical protein
MVRHLEQLRENVAADFRRAGTPGDAEAIASACYFNVEAAFDLPQVFIKLTAKIRQAVIIGGLENDVPRYLDSTQNLIPKPLCRNVPVRTTGALPKLAVNLSQQ